jgi:hypothetical protein
MEHADIDRALARDEAVDTSPGFQRQVMRAVHAHDVMTRRPLPDSDSVWPIVAAASVGLPMVIAEQTLPSDGTWVLLALCTTWAIGWFFSVRPQAV